MTDFLTKCNILADLWLNYRSDEAFEEFIQYCDLGFPLAYAIANGIIEQTDKAGNLIEETWNLLLEMLNLNDTDIAWSSLDEMLSRVSSIEE